ncbi:cadmium transporter [Bifidobacterium pseudolongum]|nr:cadmium transporter [Bifidobacterium pseudolongum]MCH4860314.1 cadmium transporter [Bifidobacterium pseudolongum]MCH4862085.1 cadmium transporter [Bifidobacterium pseudolongum]HJE56521.1 cadmium transporter [Bifidobacterium pseudolongum subsp. globosum]
MSEMTERIPMTTNHTKQGSRRSTIEAHRESGVPIMLTQAIIVACTLCFCELLCSPLYVSFAPRVFPILPWALVAMLLAVMFSYVVGFALLWCAESFAYRMKRKLQPVVYAVTGAIGFGVWTVWAVLGIMNMISGRLGMGTVSADHTTIAAINGAVLGLASFFAAFTLGERLAKHRTVVIVLGVVSVLLAVGGGYVLAAMMHAVA